MKVSGASSAIQYSAMQNSVPGASCAVGRCHDGEDGGHEKHGGRARGAGGFANLVSSVVNALAQTAAAPASVAATSGTPATIDAATAPATAAAADTANPTQDLLQKVATFMQNLFAAMGQARGHDHHHDHHHGHHHGYGHRHDSGAVAAPDGAAPASTAAVDAPGSRDVVAALAAPVASASEGSPVRHYRHNEHGGGLAGKLQSLLRQIGDGVAEDASGRLADLNTAFQSLVSALHPAGATAQPTLQDFLHKLVQNLGGSGADSGTVSGSLINATA